MPFHVFSVRKQTFYSLLLYKLAGLHLVKFQRDRVLALRQFPSLSLKDKLLFQHYLLQDVLLQHESFR
ncbi:hypothetical protein A7A78_13570 [Aequorivita soesokkakensis]|uniref:Uncharacterized protein n=1 Tax=Aequorivita soesokkakensis TaxID=1385699 RepID=A0A1A9LC84_9FLAO|nr:hypothetical protein A7A78_13570 [Aequorivita soesokkakensis]